MVAPAGAAKRRGLTATAHLVACSVWFGFALPYAILLFALTRFDGTVEGVAMGIALILTAVAVMGFLVIGAFVMGLVALVPLTIAWRRAGTYRWPEIVALVHVTVAIGTAVGAALLVAV